MKNTPHSNSADDLFIAVEDISYIVAQKLGISQDEVLARALSAFIGMEKPFAGEVNSSLQQYLQNPPKENV